MKDTSFITKSNPSCYTHPNHHLHSVLLQRFRQSVNIASITSHHTNITFNVITYNVLIKIN